MYWCNLLNPFFQFFREAKDTRFLPEKISHRAAKEFFETFTKYEQEYKHLITGECMQTSTASWLFLYLRAATNESQKTLNKC